jgi:hypothetical protein
MPHPPCPVKATLDRAANQSRVVVMHVVNVFHCETIGRSALLDHPQQVGFSGIQYLFIFVAYRDPGI